MIICDMLSLMTRREFLRTTAAAALSETGPLAAAKVENRATEKRTDLLRVLP